MKEYSGEATMPACHLIGLEVAMDEKAMKEFIVQLQETILAFIEAKSMPEMEHVIQKHPELLSEDADSLFAMLTDMQSNERAKSRFTERHKLLNSIRTRREELQSVLLTLIEAGSWSKAKRVIEQHQELLSDDADVLLEHLIDHQTSAQAKDTLIEFRELLQRCRAEGVEAVFAELMQPDEPGRLFVEIPAEFELAEQEISDLAERANLDPSLNRQRIELIERTLQHLSGDEFPGLRAALLGDLGNSYVRLPTGDHLTNLNKAIACYREALHFHTPEAAPLDYATTQHNMGGAYCELPTGDRTVNLEKAIACFQNALRFRTPEVSPLGYAATQGNLGNAYAELPTGNRAENLQKAIACYEEALRFQTSEAAPYEYATTQNNLGTAYLDLQTGDPNINQERAIECFQKALTVWTLQIAPFQYASANSNLGQTYAKLLRGNRAVNIQRAIECFEKSLKVYNPDVTPREYGETQSNLGLAYQMLPTGDRAENLHRAIICYHEALRYCSAESNPLGHAKIQFNLGNAYAELPTGDPNTNREWAIGHYEIALRYRTPDVAPLDYASTQNSMGNVYQKLLSGNRTNNLQKAINCYNNALRFRTPETTPLDYAQTMINLGLAYTELPVGDRNTNLNRAIACFQQALRFYRSETTPFEYAQVQDGLGLAYSELLIGDRVSNLQSAVACFQEALRFLPIETVPTWRQTTAHGLGNLYFREGIWEDAHQAYIAALDAGEILYRAAATEVSRHSTLPLQTFLHSKDAYCLAKLGHLERAVEQLEKSRTRFLSDVFALDQAALKRVSPQDVKAYHAARDHVKLLEAEARSVSTAHPALFLVSNLSELSTRLRAAQRELDAIVDRIRAYVPDFIPSGLDFGDIVKAATSDCPLVYLCTTTRGSLALIVPSEVKTLGPEHVVWLDNFCHEDLGQLFAFLDANGEVIASDYFAGQIGGDRTRLTKALEMMLPTLRENLMVPLCIRLKELGFHEATLIPSGHLGLLPLHAAVIELITVSYAPSARILRITRTLASERQKLSPAFLGIGNPLSSEPPLAFARSEVEEIARQFPSNSQYVLYEHQATRSKVLGFSSNATHLHFACHGRFDYDEPNDSALFLADKDLLTLRDILNGNLDISSSRLAVLSACQTGIIHSSQAPDETIGFPAAFLVAGVPGVVSTLWPVDDQRTAFLMQQFYRNHLSKGMQPAAALRAAQLWLRNLTVDEIEDVFESLGRMDKLEYARRMDELFEAYEYVHPYYWAAFVFNGV
jgi:CHAT domain-containing protein